MKKVLSILVCKKCQQTFINVPMCNRICISCLLSSNDELKVDYSLTISTNEEMKNFYITHKSL